MFACNPLHFAGWMCIWYRRTFNKALNSSDFGNDRRGPIPSPGLNEGEPKNGNTEGPARTFFLDADIVHESAGISSRERAIETGGVFCSLSASLRLSFMLFLAFMCYSPSHPPNYLSFTNARSPADSVNLSSAFTVLQRCL